MNRSIGYRYGGSIISVMLAAAALILVGLSARAQAPGQAPKADIPRAGNAQDGKRLYTSYGCYQCHGRDAQGSSVTGPRIGPRPIPFPVFLRIVRQSPGEMPPYSRELVSDSELADIYAFLQSLPEPPPAKSIRLLNEAD